MSLAIHWVFGTGERERERERDVEHAAGPILSEEGRTFGRWGHVPPPFLPGGRHAQWSRTSVKDGQMEKKEAARERDGGQSD